ncbi:unannotated protein [freshwater metagenome]|uniref:Unannotated protein n=1 Tax=freshwater metagenome TaxID=449393 RepID=A0A6J6GJH9_9ZZZZ
MTKQTRFFFEAEHERTRTGGNNDRVSNVGGLGSIDIADPHFERASGQINFGDLASNDLGAETCRLFAEFHHEFWPHDPVGPTREVLNLGGEHELPTGLVAR